MRKLLTIICTAALLLIGVTEGWSNEFQKGSDAFNIRDYATALEKWRAVAEQGLAEVQVNLALMYEKGEGVPQNYVLAHMWSSIAASNGNKTAADNIEIFEKKMSASQIQRAQKLAVECVEKNYKGC